MAAKTKTAAKSQKTTKPEAPKAEAKPSGRETDKFGNGVKTACAKINSHIGKKPITVAELVEKSGEKAVLVRNHVQTLLRKELIVRTDDGIRQK